MRITIYTCNNCVQCHIIERAMEDRDFDFEMANADHIPEAVEAPHAQGLCQLSVATVGDPSWSDSHPNVINHLHPAPHAVSA